MAGALQTETEYAALELTGALAVKRLLGFRFSEKPGEHARAVFSLLLGGDGQKRDGMGVPVHLSGKSGALFSGYPERVEIRAERGYRTAEVHALSATVLLDRRANDRVFQKKGQTCLQVADAVTACTDGCACILSGGDRETGGTLVQYRESDWDFLKRVASRMGLPLVPDTGSSRPRFYIGLPEGGKKELGKVLSCDMHFDGRYYAVSGRCPVDRRDFVCYDVVTETVLSMGDRVSIGGRELSVAERTAELSGGRVLFTYRLAGESYTRVPGMGNPDHTGMSLTGTVSVTEGERVGMGFDIDRSAEGGNTYGFAPATGNLMYCMPQKGTRTAFYLGNGDASEGTVTGCIRTNGGTCRGTGSPEKKSFRSEHGKGMDLHPGSMGLDGGAAGGISVFDGAGTTVESGNSLFLAAREKICLESMKSITVQGVSDIMALLRGGESGLCVNGNVDMIGRQVCLCGSVYQAHAGYDDAPEEGEFDWCGFARNLALGLTVMVACAAVNVFFPGVGAFATGALIGAFSATVSGAIKDLSSGNVRSVEETARDLVIAVGAGAFTGGCAVTYPQLGLLSLGLIYAGVSMTGRSAWALGDGTMGTGDRLSYIFDIYQIVDDLFTGMFIGLSIPDAAGGKAVGTAKNGAGKSNYGKSIELSEQKMYQQGKHFNKHGREMGYASKAEYENGARRFLSANKDTARIYEGVYNSSHGQLNGHIQIIVIKNGKSLIIEKDTMQIIDFYAGTSLSSFINIERVQ